VFKGQTRQCRFLFYFNLQPSNLPPDPLLLHAFNQVASDGYRDSVAIGTCSPCDIAEVVGQDCAILQPCLHLEVAVSSDCEVDLASLAIGKIGQSVGPIADYHGEFFDHQAGGISDLYHVDRPKETRKPHNSQ